jgi:GT2 family glycosyltransferase
MITIVYSTHKDENYNKKFKQHLIQTAGIKDIQILEYQNNNEFSLSQIYNRGISESTYDILVCCHNDIKLETNWGKKLLQDFDKNPEFSIIGKAGSCYFPESGVYWERMNLTMVGQVYHHPEGNKKWLSKYSPKLPFLIPVVTIDGLFISFNKTKIKHIFDETIGKFHFYDHSFCVPNYLDGVKIGVTSSFEITHQSMGQPNQEFFESKNKFLNKWGQSLPLDLHPEKLYVPEIIEKPIKNIGKIAIIIPTKGKVEMLFDCVNSFYENCNKDLFDIFIADTGSTDDEKNYIKEKILPLGNIKLIQYDYYNFAKINNDVVKTHISEDYEFLLFCNNDIKIMNNVIYEMLLIFKENKNAGTVGVRLHFKNNLVQHDSIFLFLQKKNEKENSLHITHENLNSYYKFTIENKEVLGSTGALLMIRKNVFMKCGMFNEKYINCFEDVELNLKCIILGLKNYFSGKSVAYHYESLTRSGDSENLTKMREDYVKNLLPFVNFYYEKLKHKILFIK